jgi:hypothetical protein
MVGIRRLISAAIAHQMRRPALARLLDFEQQRLPLVARNEKVAQTIANIVASLLGGPDAPQMANRSVSALDVLAIVKGMVDAARALARHTPQKMGALPELSLLVLTVSVLSTSLTIDLCVRLQHGSPSLGLEDGRDPACTNGHEGHFDGAINHGSHRNTYHRNDEWREHAWRLPCRKEPQCNIVDGLMRQID